jgi:hypothetical protein
MIPGLFHCALPRSLLLTALRRSRARPSERTAFRVRELRDSELAPPLRPNRDDPDAQLQLASTPVQQRDTATEPRNGLPCIGGRYEEEPCVAACRFSFL